MGSFRFWFEDDTWEWSAEVQRLHGYAPGTVTPTTELVLAHKHPDDRNRVAATIEAIRRGHGAFSTRHRIIDTEDIVGDQLAKIVENRAAIEQAKGMFRVIYGLDETTAFELLKWRSQETNVKLRHLAEQIATDFVALSRQDAHPLRSAYDNILLTANRRIGARHQGGAV